MRRSMAAMYRHVRAALDIRSARPTESLCVAEPHGRADPALRDGGQVIGVDDGDHRVAAGGRMVGQHHDRLAVGRHLDRARDQALARQLVVDQARARRRRPGAAPTRLTVATVHAPVVRMGQHVARRTNRRAGRATRRITLGRRPVLGDIDGDRSRRVRTDRAAGRRRPIGGGPRPDSVSCEREPRTRSTSIPPRTATYDHVGRPSTRDRQLGARRQRARCQLGARRRRATGPVARTTSPPAVSSTAAPSSLPTRRLTRAASGGSTAPAVGTPRWAKPGRPRSWIVVDQPGSTISSATLAVPAGRIRHVATNLTVVPGSSSAGGSRSTSHTRVDVRAEEVPPAR